MNYKIPKELLCEQCASESEIIIERKAEGIIVRVGDIIITHKPSHRSRLCYYHNKKQAGRFGDKKLSYR